MGRLGWLSRLEPPKILRVLQNILNRFSYKIAKASCFSNKKVGYHNLNCSAFIWGRSHNNSAQPEHFTLESVILSNLFFTLD